MALTVASSMIDPVELEQVVKEIVRSNLQRKVEFVDSSPQVLRANLDKDIDRQTACKTSWWYE